MDQARTVDTERLREAMDTTRASIRGTVEELREKMGDAVDWRHHVNRYPGASLTIAVMIGMFVGRRIGTMILGYSNGSNGSAVRSAQSGGNPGFTSVPTHVVAAHEPPRSTAEPTSSWKRSGAAQSLSASCGRAGSRLEGLLNRMIDELGDAAERTLVPRLMARVQGFLAWEPADRRPQQGVYPGAPAGTQAYPTQAARGTERP